MGMEDLKNSDKVEIEVTDGTYLYLRRCRYFSKICAQNYWPYCVKSLLQILNAFLSLLSMQDIRDVVRGRLRGTLAPPAPLGIIGFGKEKRMIHCIT